MRQCPQLIGCTLWTAAGYASAAFSYEFELIVEQFVQDLIKQGEEPEVESVKRTNLAAIPSATLDDFFSLNAARSKVKNEFQKFWLDHELDALLYPPASTTATPLDEWKCITYTMLWNLLDYPALIIPTGIVTDQDVVDDVDTAMLGEEDQQNYKLCKLIRDANPITIHTNAHRKRHRARRFQERADDDPAGRHATRRRSLDGRRQDGRRSIAFSKRTFQTIANRSV